MNRIRSLRAAMGITQAELGSMLNVKDSAVSKYENEKVPLTAETLLKLSDIFGVSVDYILGRDMDMFHNKSVLSPARSPVDKETETIIDYYKGFSESGKKEAMKYFQMLREFEKNNAHIS